MSEINAEQLQAISEIASGFENFKCVECALAIKNYLTNQNIRGIYIKLDTGALDDHRNNFIYDDSVRTYAKKPGFLEKPMIFQREIDLRNPVSDLACVSPDCAK